jgi:hypothetical protein
MVGALEMRRIILIALLLSGWATAQTEVTVEQNQTITGTKMFKNIGGLCILDGSGYTTLAQAITCAGTTGTIWITPAAGTISVPTNATIPAGVLLKISKGGILSIATGATLTILGPLDIGAYKVFSYVGTGTVSFGGPNGNEAVDHVYIQWWGGLGDFGTTDNTAALNAAVVTADSGAFNVPVYFTNGNYFFNSAPACFADSTSIMGTPNKVALTANYTEATDTNGFLCWDGHAGIGGGGHGKLYGVQIVKGNGFSGGTAIKLTTTGGGACTTRAGFINIEEVITNAGTPSTTSFWHHLFLADGTGCVVASSPGIRDIVFNQVYLAGAKPSVAATYTNYAVVFWQMVHVYTSALLIYGPVVDVNASILISGSGAGVNASQNVYISTNEVVGAVAFDQCNNCSFAGTANAGLTQTANTVSFNYMDTQLGFVGAKHVVNAGSTGSLGLFFQTAAGTLPATLTNDGAGGFNFYTNSGKNMEIQVGGIVVLPAATDYTEGTAPAANAGFSELYADSAAHCMELSNNNGTFSCVAQVIKATSSAFATATTAGTCVQNVTAVTGATTAMVATATPVTTPGVGSQWSAFVSSAGNVTINECAVAASAGGSIAFNIRVIP